MVVISTAGPMRTCIGCRQRVAASELLRIVVAPEHAAGSARAVIPDPRRRMPGRGAWLHRSLACVDLAQRRRAIGRALRVRDPIDTAAVHEYVAQLQGGCGAGDDTDSRRAGPSERP